MDARDDPPTVRKAAAFVTRGPVGSAGTVNKNAGP
jgi:hypothetical protein